MPVVHQDGRELHSTAGTGDAGFWAFNRARASLSVAISRCASLRCWRFGILKSARMISASAREGNRSSEVVAILRHHAKGQPVFRDIPAAQPLLENNKLEAFRDCVNVPIQAIDPPVAVFVTAQVTSSLCLSRLLYLRRSWASGASAGASSGQTLLRPWSTSRLLP